MRILLIEDEPGIASFIITGLTAQGITVYWQPTTQQLSAHIAETRCDILILDILLPGQGGLTALKDLRAQGHTLPILLLTALTAPHQRVTGLDTGADDYLGKPFHLEELTARLRALARRAAPRQTTLTLADLTLDLITRQVTRAGVPIETTPREFALLEFLIQCEGRVVSRSAILLEAWKYNFEPTTNVVEVFIRRLRAKIDGPFPVKLLHTIRHLGYALRVEP